MKCLECGSEMEVLDCLGSYEQVVHTHTPGGLECLRNQLAEAKGVLERLPKTKDGVVIVPGTLDLVYSTQKAFRLNNGHICGQAPIWKFVRQQWQIYDVPVSECYSTEELAKQDALDAQEESTDDMPEM